MRKLFALLLTFAMLTALAACRSGTTDTGNGSNKSGDTAAPTTSSGQTSGTDNTGTVEKVTVTVPENLPDIAGATEQVKSFSILVPDGWKVLSNHDNYIQMNCPDSAKYPNKYPVVTVEYSSYAIAEDQKIAEEKRGLTDIKDIAPLEIGGRGYVGFIGFVPSKLVYYACLYSSAEGEGTFSVTVSIPEGQTLDDAASFAVIASLALKP